MSVLIERSPTISPFTKINNAFGKQIATTIIERPTIATSASAKSQIVTVHGVNLFDPNFGKISFKDLKVSVSPLYGSDGQILIQTEPRPLDILSETQNDDYITPLSTSIPRGPRRRTTTDMCIVLDLDETLIHTMEDMAGYQWLKVADNPVLRNRCYTLNMIDVSRPHGHDRGKGQITEMWGVYRPHVHRFLAFCFSYFKMVIVWSAGIGTYVRNVVDNLFVEEPHAVFSRRHCTHMGRIYDKNLNKIYKDRELSRYAKPHNTIILDDRNVSYKTNTPNNGVLIPRYTPKASQDNILQDDHALLQMIEWLSHPSVIACKDVRMLTKQHFGMSLAQIREHQSFMV